MKNLIKGGLIVVILAGGIGLQTATSCVVGYYQKAGSGPIYAGSCYDGGTSCGYVCLAEE